MNTYCLKDLSSHLFWDININTLDIDFNKRIIIERVFDRGDIQDLRILLNLYDLSTIKSEIIKVGFLDKKSINWASNFLKIPKSKFRCYKKIQLNKTHWNY